MAADVRIEASSKIWTIPNALSVVRLALIPVFLFFIVAQFDALALGVLIVSSGTDYLDGYLARRLNQTSQLGRVLDPVADRIYILSTLLGLGWRDFMPWWLVAVIISRDVLLLVLGVILANRGFGPLAVHHLGKVATFCLLLGFPLLMLGAAFEPLSELSRPIGGAFAVWGAFLYWWAGMIYVRETARVIRIPPVDSGNFSDTLGR